MTERIIIAGAGGQGIMLMGRVIAWAALREGREVSWIPSYGAEVRGGTAYCMVIISDEDIPSPFIDKADTLIIMNEASLEKFKQRIYSGGLVIINSSLVKKAGSLKIKFPSGIRQFWGEFSGIASQLGNIKVANMVALGAYLALKYMFSLRTVSKVMEEIAPAAKKDLIEINQQAVSSGAGLIKKRSG